MQALSKQLASGRQPLKALQDCIQFIGQGSVTETRTFSSQLAPVVLSTNGATDNIVAYLLSEDESIKQRAMAVLLSLSDASEQFRAKVASGHLDTVIPIVMDAVEPSIVQHRDREHFQHVSLYALAALAKNADAAQAAAAAGGFDVLVRLLNAPTATVQAGDVKCLASGALLQMTHDSVNRSRQAASAGAIPVLSRMALSQCAEAQVLAASCLKSILAALTPAQMSTNKQHVKVAIAALARLVSRNTLPGTLKSTIQDTSATALGALLVFHKVSSVQSNTDEHGWVKAEVAKALARANAGPTLLRMGSSQSFYLIACMIPEVPEQVSVLAHTEGSIPRLKQLMHSPEVTVRTIAAQLLESFKDESLEIERLVGQEFDTAGVLAEGLQEYGHAAAACECFSCACCGAGAGVGDVKLFACSACRVVAYCSKACQKAHWKVHKPSCVRRG